MTTTQMGRSISLMFISFSTLNAHKTTGFNASKGINQILAIYVAHIVENHSVVPLKNRPNLCIVHSVCTHCLDENISCDSQCEYCGANERVFAGPSTTDDFCRWLLFEENTGATVLCHNFKGYEIVSDSQLFIPERNNTKSNTKRCKEHVCRNSCLQD